MNGITVVIPTVPSRNLFLGRAVGSTSTQTMPPDAVIVVHDTGLEGAPIVRTRGLDLVQTPWVAFLDDDDELGPNHLEKLHHHAITTGADMVFPWFHVMGGQDPFPANEKKPWTIDDPHQTTVTMLVKTDAARAVGGFVGDEDQVDPDCPGTDAEGHRAGEEYRFVLRLAAAGYKIEKLFERTWTWHHWQNGPKPGNTSGMPSRL